MGFNQYVFGDTSTYIGDVSNFSVIGRYEYASGAKTVRRNFQTSARAILDHAFISISLSNGSFIRSFIADNCLYVGDYAFAQNENKDLGVYNVKMSQCRWIGRGAFLRFHAPNFGYYFTDFSFPECEYISDEAFQECWWIGSFYASRVRHIGNSAFESCYHMQPVMKFPYCEYVGDYAFYMCTSDSPSSASGIYNAYLPNCSHLGNRAFGNTKLTILQVSDYMNYVGALGITSPLSIYGMKKINQLGDSAFYSCTILSPEPLFTASLISDVPSVPSYAFGNVYGQSMMFEGEVIVLSKCSFIGSEAFFCGRCHFIELDAPICSRVGNAVFCAVSTLSILRLPRCEEFGSRFFSSDYYSGGTPNLRELWLNEVTRVPIFTYASSRSAYDFKGCPSLQAIYVPSSLVTAFKLSPSWSPLSTKIVGV